MEDNFKDYFTGSKKLFTTYLGARWKLLRLEATEKVAYLVGILVTLMIAAVVGLFIIVFLGFLFAYWMSDVVGSLLGGFALTAALFFILFIIVLLLGKWLIRRPLASILIAKVAKKIINKNERKKT